MAASRIIATALALALAAPGLGMAQQAADQAQPGGAAVGAEAHHLINKKAVSAQGKELGKIKDVLVGPDGRVQAMIVDYKGKDRAVPWDQVKIQGDQVSISMADQEVSQLPEYKGEKK